MGSSKRAMCSIAIAVPLYIYMLTPPPQWTHRGWQPSPSQIKGKTTKQETNQNQKTKKPSFPKLWGWGLQKIVFLVFSRKRWFFWFETIFFSRKRWFLEVFSWQNHLFLEKKDSKPSFSREKDCFEPKNHLFLEKTKNTKKTIFWRRQPHSFGKDGFFGFFGFLEKKMVFLFETIFFSRKR